MSFISIEFFYLLILPLIYFFFYKFKQTDILYFFIFLFIVVALARPIIIKEIEEDESKVEFIVSLDISKSMLAKDVLPNRFEFSKQKISSFFKLLTNQKLALMAYSNQPYLISPFTNNYDVLRFFIENLHLKNINQNGSNIMKLLEASNQFFSSKINRAVLILTDGTDQQSFEKEIEYAQENNISVFIYLIATTKGTVIEYKENLVKDKSNKIIVSKKNEHIKELVLKTNGEYLEYSFNKNDLKEIIDSITKKYKSNLLKTTSENKQELFYYFLGIAFILYIFTRFDITRRIK